MSLAPLPIDPLLERIVDSVIRDGAVVLSAPPGAGKTTRVPRALLESGALTGDIVVLEPRRLAARVAARRVAEELGEPVGGRIGFQTRFERAVSKATRVRFITEGMLSRRLLSDPNLSGTGAVLLDEVHERHLATDVALGHLARLRRTTRPDLRIVAMSATLDAAPVAAFLGAEVIVTEGRAYPVDVEHARTSDDRPLASQVASAVQRLVAEGTSGHLLVFLPGAREIRAAAASCAAIAKREGILVLPLHGSLSVEEQDRAVRPGPSRKLILATNVAETSVTIDGVTAVVDSGLCFAASLAPWSGLPTLRLAKIAKASAAQRAGRAGRTGPGRCVRLYTAHDLAIRPAFETPEVQRLDISETILELVAAGVDTPSEFPWFEPPDARRFDAAVALLTALGAIEARGEGRFALTPTGKRMSRFPLHPRQARMLVEAERLGVAADGCLLAALVAERDIRANAAEPYRGGAAPSDVLLALDALDAARSMGRDAQRAAGFDPARVERVTRIAKELEGLAVRDATAPADPATHEQALLRTVLVGYPDRVGRLRHPETSTGRRGVEIVLAAGGTAHLADSSAVRAGGLVVAVDAEERVTSGRQQVVVRWASAVDTDLVLDVLTDNVTDEAELVFSEARGRVEEVRRLKLGALVLDERQGAPRDASAAAKVLAGAVLARAAHAGSADIGRLTARLGFARRARPDVEVPALDEAAIASALERACENKTSLAELPESAVIDAVEAWLGGDVRRRLDSLAPERVALPSGRSVVVEYPADGAPNISSRIQDFFGMREGPAVAGGRVPLVLHLLAPNHRAVQVTTDLAGFWARHYPAIARELRRRYPRHPFPDDPLNASPPAARRR